MKALVLGIDSVKHDWPDQWMPVLRRFGFETEWHSLGRYWHDALPQGSCPDQSYDLRSISDFARYRQGDADGLKYAEPDMPDSTVLRVIGYLEELLHGPVSTGQVARLESKRPDLLCVWSHTTFQYRAATTIAKRLGIPIFYFEGAFFASPRTSAHMHIIDPVGVYFQGSSYLAEGWERWKNIELAPAQHRGLDHYLTKWESGKCSKYEQSGGAIAWLQDKPVLFVPLQTPHDGTMWWPDTVVNTPADLVRTVVEYAVPLGWYPIFKKHPRDRTPITNYMCDASSTEYAIVDGGNIHDLVRISQGVVLINSTVGIEALALGRRVLTLGESFYGGNGWTIDVKRKEDLTAGLEELQKRRQLSESERESLRRFLYYLLWVYLADFNDPLIDVRYKAACEEASRQLRASEVLGYVI